MPSSTFAPDHHLVSRYRIIQLIGVGRTTEVYTAQDLSLQRTVVVKVLLSHLAAHEDVRRAFRDRIIRAATLSHPHLARVFDGGQEAGAIFMITEYLGGGSLEDVLATGRTLNTDDGARLGRDVASALAYAHANGFVHGSLSPSKLLFDDEGRVRVSDVALAGLGDAYRERFTLDDVRYLSPEQAIGDPAGPKSDVYALALILFEAVTGTTAFDGLTPEAVLRARISAPLPIRPELGTLDMLLAQAAVPDPLLRLDAEQFASRLSAVVSDAAPLVVSPGRSEVPLLAQFTPTEPRNSIGFRPPSPDQIIGSTSVVPTVNSAPRPAPGRSGAARDWVPTQNGPTDDGPGGPGRDDFAGGRPPARRRLAFLGAAILLVLVAVGAGAAWKLGAFTQSHTVPSLTRVTIKDAQALLSADGFTLTVTQHQNSSTIPAGEILSQSPAAGTSAKSGLVIYVTLSDGTAMVTLPTNLVGEDCVNATLQLAKLKVTAQCPTSAAVASMVTPAGRIAKVLYHSTVNPLAVPKGSTVVLVLSTGKPASATTTTTAPPTTNPTTTTTTATSTTTTTTLAHPLRAVPNVAGLTRAQVFAAMKKAELFFTTQGPGSATSTWTTGVSTIPAAGTMVKWESTIIVNVK
ncbi:MAG TPA: protein kinase [Acidimicrobiales bacterium]|nr:protein kinase [Acidimicrobiales bacterium]